MDSTRRVWFIMVVSRQTNKELFIGMWESAVNEFIELDSNQFPSVQWEDAEPTEVEIM